MSHTKTRLVVNFTLMRQMPGQSPVFMAEDKISFPICAEYEYDEIAAILAAALPGIMVALEDEALAVEEQYNAQQSAQGGEDDGGNTPPETPLVA